MYTFVIQKYPKFNNQLTFDDIVDIEAMVDNESYGDKEDNDIEYDKEIIDFYKPYYTTYKTEKYWYNSIDNSLSLHGMASLRENLFLNQLPCGVIDWLEEHIDGDMYSYCILTKKILEDLLELCRKIGFDAKSAEKTFPSDIDKYDVLYFQCLFIYISICLFLHHKSLDIVVLPTCTCYKNSLKNQFNFINLHSGYLIIYIIRNTLIFTKI